jgi:hypothetical protein
MGSMGSMVPRHIPHEQRDGAAARTALLVSRTQRARVSAHTPQTPRAHARGARRVRSAPPLWISHLIRVSAGYSERPDEERIYWEACEAALNGLGSLKSTDLSVALAGADAYASAHCSKGSRSLSGGGGASKLMPTLQLAAACVKLARFDAAHLARALRDWKEAWLQRKADPSYYLSQKLSQLTKGHRSHAHAEEYGTAHFRRRLAALEAPNACATMAVLRRGAMGESSAGAWAWVLVGALPPDVELQATLEATLGAFSAAPIYALCPPAAAEALPSFASDAAPPTASGWLRFPRHFPHLPAAEKKLRELRRPPTRFWRSVRTARVRAGKEESCRTIMLLPAERIPDVLKAARMGGADDAAGIAISAIHTARDGASAATSTHASAARTCFGCELC